MTGDTRWGYALGTRRGIAACASARGTFAVLALDHRQNLRKELRPADPASVTYDEMVEFKRAVVRALAPVATGTLLDPAARDAFLATTGRERLRRLADLVDATGRPWQDRPSRVTSAPIPGDGWCRDY